MSSQFDFLHRTSKWSSSVNCLFIRMFCRSLSLCLLPFAKYRNNKSTFRFGRMRVLMTDSHSVPKFVSHRSFHYFYLNWCSQATCIWQRCSPKGMSSVRHAWDFIMLAAFALSPSVTLCHDLFVCVQLLCVRCACMFAQTLMKIDVWIEIDFLLFDLIFTSAERIPAATAARS